MSNAFDIDRCRDQFPALCREMDGKPVVFLDGPAGSQVPRRVVEAMARYLRETNANTGGAFATSRESDALLLEARRGVADLLGSDDPQLAAFGPNMTTLTLSLARALARTWKPGDEVVVTRLEHDANFTPWTQAAADAGATVRYVSIRKEDCTLDIEQLQSLIGERTKFVAVGAASNAVGTINPVRRIVELAHGVGAHVFVDAVHLAPHAAIDVQAWDCDWVVCSGYKFFGPHGVGVLWGKRELLEQLPAYKLRPSSNELPGRWETGTLNHEGIAGTLAAIDYLAELGRRHEPRATDRRSALLAAYAAIERYEDELAGYLLEGLSTLRGVRVWGITDRRRIAERVPTVSITHDRRSPSEIAELLAGRGLFVWEGNYYALSVTEALGLEPDGMVRIGLLHYNTREEIDRLIDALGAL
jgi:cysteine desulfurase family protein (TIGR01976 family)